MSRQSHSSGLRVEGYSSGKVGWQWRKEEDSPRGRQQVETRSWEAETAKASLARGCGHRRGAFSCLGIASWGKAREQEGMKEANGTGTPETVLSRGKRWHVRKQRLKALWAQALLPGQSLLSSSCLGQREPSQPFIQVPFSLRANLRTNPLPTQHKGYPGPTRRPGHWWASSGLAPHCQAGAGGGTEAQVRGNTAREPLPGPTPQFPVGGGGLRYPDVTPQGHTPFQTTPL